MTREEKLKAHQELEAYRVRLRRDHPADYETPQKHPTYDCPVCGTTLIDDGDGQPGCARHRGGENR